MMRIEDVPAAPLVQRYVSRNRDLTVPAWDAARVTAHNLADIARWCGGVVQGATIAVPLPNADSMFRPSGGQIARPSCVVARTLDTGFVVFAAAEWDNAMVLESVALARQAAMLDNQRRAGL